MRFLAFTVLLALAACSPSAPSAPTTTSRAVSLANVPSCSAEDSLSTASADHPFWGRECKIVVGNQTIHVRFQGMPTEAQSGVVAVDIIGEHGAVRQSFSETDVDYYVDPEAVDFDEDGHIDLEIPITIGNDNRDLALWRYDPAQSRFVRLGDVSGIIHHTRDGYLAVAGKSSAAEWDVSFYTIGPSALGELITVNVAAEGDDQGNVTRTTCTIGRQGPAFASLNMSADAARTKFCAEPAARVFDQ